MRHFKSCLFMTLSGLLFLVCPIHVQSQKAFNRDSLLSVINNPVTTDSVRLLTLDEMVRNYFFRNPDSVIYYSEILLELSENLNDEKHIGWALNNIGYSYHRKGDQRNSLKFHLRNLGRHMLTRDSSEISNIYLNIGIIFSVTEDYEQAFANYSKAQKYLPPYSPAGTVNRLLMNKALVYGRMGDHVKCLDLLVERLVVAKADTIDNIGNTTSILYNIGYEHQALKHWEEALSFYEQSLESSNETNLFDIQPYLYNSMAEVHLEKEELDLAKLSLSNNQEILSTQNNLGELSRFHYLSAKLFGDSEPTKVVDHLRDAIRLAGLSKSIHNQIDAMELMSDVLHNGGETEEAFLLQKRTNSMKDSLSELDLERKALALEMRTEMATKEKEFQAALENQISRSTSRLNKYILFFTGLIVFCLAVTIYILLKIRNQHQSNLYQIKIQKQLKDTLLTPDNIDIKSLAILKEPTYGRINDTDKQILECIQQNPLISNQEIADRVNRSLEGVSSSLRKMYKQFNIPPGKNRKLELVETLFRLHKQQFAAKD